MKKNLVHMSGAFALFAALVATCALAADKPAAADSKAGKTSSGATPDEQEMMKKWQAAATPGPNHKALEPLVGEWDLVTRFGWPGRTAP